MTTTFPIPPELNQTLDSLRVNFAKLTPHEITDVGYLGVNNSAYCRNVGLDLYEIRQTKDGFWIFSNGSDYHQDSEPIISSNPIVIECFRIITISELDEYKNRHIDPIMKTIWNPREDQLNETDKAEFDGLRDSILNPIVEAIQCCGAFSYSLNSRKTWTISVLDSPLQDLDNIQSEAVAQHVFYTLLWWQEAIYTRIGSD